MSELSRCISETQTLTESLKTIFIQGGQSLSVSLRMKVSNYFFVKIQFANNCCFIKKCWISWINLDWTLLPSEKSNWDTSPSLQTDLQVAVRKGLIAK